MKILHVVPTYWPATRYGGPIYSVHGLCAALADKNIQVSVFTTSVDGHTNSDVEHQKAYYKDGVEIYYYESKILRRIYYSQQLRQALLKRVRDFDLVHLHSIYLFPTNIAARIAWQYGVPYVLSPRGMLEKSLIENKSSLVKQTWLKLFEQKTIEQSSLMHLTSERECRQLDQFNYSFPPAVVIPNGVRAVQIPHRTRRFGKNVLQILYLGRINWKKQIECIIESLQYLDFAVKFIVAGNDEEGYSRTLHRLIYQLELNAQPDIEITFSGEVDDEQKRNLFFSSDVMILPSKSENFGNTVIEAMAHGCPVIVTPQVGASEIVQTIGAGYVTDASPKSIAQGISKIKNNLEQTKMMSEKGRIEIQKNYIWPVIADQMIKAYQGVIA